jgi:hypothetical protein
LAVAWIYYQKAYDSVPHSWILESMKLYKIYQKIQRVVQESMRHWCTMLTSSGEALAGIQIKCGIFQEDALSPLLFCVARPGLTIRQTKHVLRASRAKGAPKFLVLFFKSYVKLFTY